VLPSGIVAFLRVQRGIDHGHTVMGGRGKPRHDLRYAEQQYRWPTLTEY
jgi:hypothetical protein